jgi:ABC-type transport system substrate-binding protein
MEQRMFSRRSVLVSAAIVGLFAVADLPGEAAAQGQGATLVVAAQRTPEGFDGDALRPGTQEVVVQTYEGLVRYARRKAADGTEELESTKYEGHYAESWTVSADGRVVRFKLRNGIRSPFGNELTAEDVVWGYKKSVAQKRTGGFLMEVAKVTDVVAVGRYDVEYRLSAPSAFLFPILTLYAPGIYDSTEMKKHATAEDPWALRYLETRTAGFGAYHVESVTGGEQAVFVANPNYFLGPPHFRRVVYRAVPSAANRALLMRSGQVQWTENLSPQAVEEMARDPRFRVAAKPHRGAAALALNPAFPPFDNPKVRQAVGWAIDREVINRAVFGGRGVIANTIVPPYIEGAAQDMHPFPRRDVGRARQLLAEAGFPNGVDVELIHAELVGWEEPFAIQAKAMLDEVGIRTTLRKISPTELRTRNAIGRRDMPFHTAEDGPIVLDAAYTTFIVARTGGTSNRSAYSDPELDKRIDLVGETLDDTARLAMGRDIQRDWLNAATYILTAFRPLHEVMPRNIVGFVWYPYEHERWVDLRVAN